MSRVFEETKPGRYYRRRWLPRQAYDNNWPKYLKSVFKYVFYKPTSRGFKRREGFSWSGSYVCRYARHARVVSTHGRKKEPATDAAPDTLKRGDSMVRRIRRKFGRKILVVWEAPNHRGAWPAPAGHFHWEPRYPKTRLCKP